MRPAVERFRLALVESNQSRLLKRVFQKDERVDDVAPGRDHHQRRETLGRFAGDFFAVRSRATEDAQPSGAREVRVNVLSKTYHARARRGGMVSAGQILEELAERAAARQRRKRSVKLQGGLQLELFADEPIPRDAERPLFDLLPEAYPD
jgi:hypothetical protein